MFNLIVDRSRRRTGRFSAHHGGRRLIGEIEEHEYGRFGFSSIRSRRQQGRILRAAGVRTLNPRSRPSWRMRLADDGSARAPAGRRCWPDARCRRASPAGKTGLNLRIEHIVVIYAENRSFDNLYGSVSGANGSPTPRPAQYTQVDNATASRSRRCRRYGRAGIPTRRFRVICRIARSDRCAADQPAASRQLARGSGPRVLPEPGARSTAAATIASLPQCDAGATGDGLLRRTRSCRCGRWAQQYTLARQFLHGRVRRLVSEPPVADLRVHARSIATPAEPPCPGWTSAAG